MGIEQERNALVALAAETESLSSLAKSFYMAVTQDPRVKSQGESHGMLDAPRAILKPAGT